MVILMNPTLPQVSMYSLPILTSTDYLKIISNSEFCEFLNLVYNAIGIFGRQNISPGAPFDFTTTKFRYLPLKQISSTDITTITSAIFLNNANDLVFKSPSGTFILSADQKIVIPHYVDEASFSLNKPSYSTILYDDGADKLKFYNSKTQTISEITMT